MQRRFSGPGQWKVDQQLCCKLTREEKKKRDQYVLVAEVYVRAVAQQKEDANQVALD